AQRTDPDRPLVDPPAPRLVRQVVRAAALGQYPDRPGEVFGGDAQLDAAAEAADAGKRAGGQPARHEGGDALPREPAAGDLRLHVAGETGHGHEVVQVGPPPRSAVAFVTRVTRHTCDADLCAKPQLRRVCGPRARSVASF